MFSQSDSSKQFQKGFLRTNGIYCIYRAEVPTSACLTICLSNTLCTQAGLHTRECSQLFRNFLNFMKGVGGFSNPEYLKLMGLFPPAKAFQSSNLSSQSKSSDGNSYASSYYFTKCSEQSESSWSHLSSSQREWEFRRRPNDERQEPTLILKIVQALLNKVRASQGSTN